MLSKKQQIRKEAKTSSSIVEVIVDHPVIRKLEMTSILWLRLWSLLCSGQDWGSIHPKEPHFRVSIVSALLMLNHLPFTIIWIIYHYLRVDTGWTRLCSLKDLKISIISDTKSVCSSRLTDWQKVDAINTFIISCASYHLRAARPSIGWAIYY